MRYVVDFEANRRHVGSAVVRRLPEVGELRVGSIIEWRNQTWKVISRSGHIVRARLTYAAVA